jgi:putative spermidine/putrescine transport system ATP-binding protein
METSPSAAARRTDDTPVAGGSPGAPLSIEGVSKRFADQLAVDDVSLAIEAGEFVTFLGPSGSGKTTTLNMIAGFEEPDAGRIVLDGRSIAELPPHRRNIGMVFQNYALFPHMTALQNTAFPLQQRRVGRHEVRRRAMEALELVHMGQYADRLPRQLSGGQQQRIAVARAIVFNPRVLLMDEPLGALDKKLRDVLQLEIRRIHRELGITFIYVTHDQEEALVLSDRIAVFNEGRIVQVGTCDDLYRRPRTRFVADFIGASNIFTGTLATTPDGLAVEIAGLRLGVAEARGCAPGDGVLLVVRPEAIELVAPEEALGDDVNRLPGSIEEAINVGDAHRYLVQVAAGGHRVTVRVPSTHGAPRFSAGDRVVATWSRHGGVVIPERASA